MFDTKTRKASKLDDFRISPFGGYIKPSDPQTTLPPTLAMQIILKNS